MSFDLLIILGLALILYGTLMVKGTRPVLATVLSVTFSFFTTQYLFTSGVLNVSLLIQQIIIAILFFVGLTSFSSVLRNRKLGQEHSKKLLGLLISLLAALYIVGIYLQLLPDTLYRFGGSIEAFYAQRIGFTGALFLIPFILPIVLKKVD